MFQGFPRSAAAVWHPKSGRAAVGVAIDRRVAYNSRAMSAKQMISLDQVRHVAKLARLAIPEEKLPDFTAKLEGILEYVDLLSEVNVDGVEPTSHALKLSNVLREDVVRPGLAIDLVLANAPHREGRFFEVPKVIGADDDSAG